MEKSVKRLPVKSYLSALEKYGREQIAAVQERLNRERRYELFAGVSIIQTLLDDGGKTIPDLVRDLREIGMEVTRELLEEVARATQEEVTAVMKEREEFLEQKRQREAADRKPKKGTGRGRGRPKASAALGSGLNNESGGRR